MPNVFTVIPDEFVVLRQNGVFKQVTLYSYGEHVFAKYGSGFIGLRKPNGNYPTTKPDVTWVEDSLGFTPTYTDGKMAVPK